MSAYYNEIDPFAAQWLRNLIAGGHIAAGDVDERSIADVVAADLAGYTQCHFFAGIGGWSHALRLAGWDDARPVWTGSCPCQPFSSAGQGKAADDERHLWPCWASLIAECRPGTVFGEQVEAAIGWGWLDAVFNDLEAESYACGAAILPACGVGAPHIRNRIWWVADAGCERGELGYADSEPDECGRGILPAEEGESGGRGDNRPGGSGSPWHPADWIPCRDGKARPVKSGIQPLAHGVSGRVGKLRAAGNAIVPQVAAGFIGAFIDASLERAA